MTRLGARDGFTVLSVTAHVELDSGRQIIRAPESGAEVEEVAPAAHRDPKSLHLNVRLSPLTDSNERVRSPQADFGIGGPRRGIGAIWHRYRGPKLSEDPDEETELLNQTYRVGLFGSGCPTSRTPSTRCWGVTQYGVAPPRLSWGKLIDALAVRASR